MVFNQKVAIVGGGVVTLGLVMVLGLVVMRAQSPKPTVTLPKAAGTGACTGTTATDVGYCGGGGTCNGSNGQLDCSCGCPTKNKDGTYTPNCNPPVTGKYSCQYTSVDTRCYTRVPADCGQFTSQSVCVSYPGCSWGTVSNLTASSPIGGKEVGSLTPTFSWAGDSSGVSYQVLCVGAYADGNPPGSCNFVNCTKDFGSNDRSYTLTTPLSPNTDYRWLVYWQPGNPAPTTGCQSFRTPNVQTCPAGQTLCGTTCVDAKTNANNCGACGAKCSSGQSCLAGVCGTSCSTSVIAPTLVSPADKATGVETRPTFQWDFGQDKACTSGLTYRLYSGTSVSNVALFEGAVVPGTQCAGPSGAACSFTPTAAASLQNGTKYYWKVQTLRGSDSTTADSAIQSFTTGGSNQVNTCWGNGGADGTCVDCNGDGVVNVLDFSCFSKLYAKPVQ